ncbi:MAG: AsmA-like C-terminal domain-containing protein, partial [Desulfatitalea sp.]
NGLQVKVDIATFALAAQYDRLPFPISAQGQTLTYSSEGLAFQEINASMQASRVEGLSGRITWNPAPRMALQGRVVHLACAELYPWLANLPGLRTHAQAIESIDGRISLADFQINGPPADAAQWQFQCAGRFDEVTLRGPQLPSGPLTLRAGRFSARNERLEAQFKWPGDVKIAAALTWGPADFFLEKLTLSDASSAATIQLRHNSAANTWDFSYKGLLEKATLAKLWRKEPIHSGWLKGEFSAHLPVDAPSQAVVRGRLEGADLLVPLGAYGPLQVHHLDLGSKEKSLSINALDFTFDQQRIGVTGHLLFSANALEPALSVTAETLDLGRIEQLLAQYSSGDAPREKQAARARPNIQGSIAVRLGRLVYSPYTWEPMQATVVLAGGQTTVTVTRATLCGISTVGTLGWTPEGMALELLPSAQGATLNNAIGCLTGTTTTERVDGTFDIDGKVTASGKSGQEMVARLGGILHLKAINGRVTNVGEVGLLTNLLSYLQINSLIKGDLPDLRERDFKYKSIDLQLLFRDGFVELQEGNLTSDALNLVAEGKMGLSDKQLSLTVLVSPLTTVDAVVRHIPVVGKILRGTLVAIPVGVQGPLSDPEVVPLSPKAVGSRLLGILERTVKAPFELVEPILPKSKGQESGSDQGSGNNGTVP